MKPTTKHLVDAAYAVKKCAEQNYKKGFPPSRAIVAEYQALFNEYFKVGIELGSFELEENIVSILKDEEFQKMVEWESKMIDLVKMGIVKS